jgi:hypothetical protein
MRTSFHHQPEAQHPKSPAINKPAGRLPHLFPRLCSLIPGLGVKLSANILAGPTVLSAVGARPPHDGVRRRWWINVASAVALSGTRKKSDDLTTATVPAGTSFPAVLREPL